MAVAAAERQVARQSVDEGRILARRYGAYENSWRRGWPAGGSRRCWLRRVRWGTRRVEQSEMKLLMGVAAVGSRVARAIVGVNETVARGESASECSGAGGMSGGAVAGCAGGVGAVWA